MANTGEPGAEGVGSGKPGPLSAAEGEGGAKDSWWSADLTSRRIIPVKGILIAAALVIFVGCIGWYLTAQINEAHDRELAKNPITRAEAESVPTGASIRDVVRLLGEPSATQPGQDVDIDGCIYYPWRANTERDWVFCPGGQGGHLQAPSGPGGVPLLTPGAFRAP